MKSDRPSPTMHRLLAVALLALTGPALAQYLWIDEKGVKQLSDRPPPPSVPAKRILKAPGKPLLNPAAAPEVPAEPALATEPAPAKAPASLADRNADYNRRRTEAAQADQKASEEAARKADQAANCAAARNNQRALDQGIRMSGYDSRGERTILGDTERAEMARKSQQILANCK